MSDDISRLLDLIDTYEELFGEGSRYVIPEPAASGVPNSIADMIALYERCLADNKPWKTFVTLPEYRENVLY